MSPLIFGCIVCGHVIYDYDSSAEGSWLGEFRASMVFQVYDKDPRLILSVYSSPEGIFISGVGRYNDPADGTWIAPLDPATRWDDQDVFQAGDDIPVMRQRPKNNRHGFVLHNACWRLLQKALEPEDVPLERLLKLCKSLPFPLRGISVCWNHDYGGLTAFDDQHHYPWEDQLIEQSSGSEIHQYARENPYNIPEISEPLKMHWENPPHLFAKTQTGDRFSTLPGEILDAIAINLPTGDALVLRRASRAFLFVLTSQIFWASRFQPGHEREHVFETRNKEQRDWISLYRRTSYALSPPGLKNRKRIWGLIRRLIVLLPLRRQYWELLPILSSVEGLKWIEVEGDVKRTRGSSHCEYFNEGCRLFHMQFAPLPSDLSKIAFSIVAAGDVTYVTGIRLIHSDNAETRLGYLAEGNESFVEVTVVKGFVLAMGPRGIRAIQAIGVNEYTSKWFGCPTESPVTERLAGCESISALQIGFDGYKIVSLAVGEPNLPCVPQSGTHGSTLRTTALWYPTVPSPNVCLNDESFIGECPSTGRYQPLFWTLFGGPGGIYLRSLTEVSVTRLGDLCSIEFRYDTEDISKKTRTLGRRNITEFSRITRFPIDGPGGELIQSVDVSIERLASERANSLYRHGRFCSFRISTNRGRSIHFQPEASSLNNPSLIPLSIAPGTTITGFYASQHPEAGLVSLGVMSEVIE